MTDARNETLDIACLALGRLIAAQCPPGFEKAVLGVDQHEGRFLLRIVATQADGWEIQVPLSEEPVQNMLETLRAVQKAMAEEDPRPWKGATVTLRKGGHFDLDVSY
jgi:hypothetical protein